MKRIFTLFILMISYWVYGQTNSYPSSGNVKIFSVGETWSEGLTIVRPTSWSGIRFTRSDPAGGTYEGNWAIGYNANTGNDFSFTTLYGGTQYDGVLHLSNSTRNVGIGTTTPSARLHVNGNIKSNNLSLGSTSYDYLGSVEFGTIEFPRAQLLFSNSNIQNQVYLMANAYYNAGFKYRTTSNMAGIGIDSGTISFFTAPSGTVDTAVPLEGRLTIANDGAVAIGHTPVAGYKLAVGGKIIGEEVNVKLQGNWPDYVFEKDYALPSLEEIKTYIDQHKHLPEVPSAKEMEVNGMQLGEMNMLLLKKMEEMTLYMIDLKNENTTLKERVNKIENEKQK